MNANSNMSPVQVYAGDIYDVALVKGRLIRDGIEVFLLDEIKGTLCAWQTKPGKRGIVKLLVMPEDVTKASQLVKKVKKSKKN
jgi:hypothetical protein